MSKAKAENRALPRRFYQKATAEQGRILLDGKELKTSAKNPLRIVHAALAEAIAAEWNAQGIFIDPATMPLTRLMNITIDRVPVDREALLQSIYFYGETDLTCYRSDDQALSERQRHAFDPVLAWAKSVGIVCHVTEGVMPIVQPSGSLRRMEELLREANDGELAALAMMTPLLGSVLMAMAVWKGARTIDQALIAARLDEAYQAEKWGADEEAENAWKNKRLDIIAAANFLGFSRAA